MHGTAAAPQKAKPERGGKSNRLTLKAPQWAGGREVGALQEAPLFPIPAPAGGSPGSQPHPAALHALRLVAEHPTARPSFRFHPFRGDVGFYALSPFNLIYQLPGANPAPQHTQHKHTAEGEHKTHRAACHTAGWELPCSPSSSWGLPFILSTPHISWREPKSITANGCLGRVTGREENTKGEGLGCPASVTPVRSTEN